MDPFIHDIIITGLLAAVIITDLRVLPGAPDGSRHAVPHHPPDVARRAWPRDLRRCGSR